MPFRTVVVMIALSIAIAFSIAKILSAKNGLRYRGNDGVVEIARFFAFAEVCHRDSLVSFGDVQAVRRNAIKLGYNPTNRDMIEEASRMSEQIKKNEANTICDEYQAHIDKVLFAYGYKVK